MLKPNRAPGRASPTKPVAAIREASAADEPRVPPNRRSATPARTGVWMTASSRISIAMGMAQGGGFRPFANAHATGRMRRKRSSVHRIQQTRFAQASLLHAERSICFNRSDLRPTTWCRRFASALPA